MTAQRIEITAEEALALLDRLKNNVSATDYQIIKGLVDTHLLLEQMVSEKNTSISRLLKMIFGHKTEKTGKGNGSKKKATKPKGHGKNGAGNYVGAQHKKIKHAILHHCDPCPHLPGRKTLPATDSRDDRSNKRRTTASGNCLRTGKVTLQHLWQGFYR